MKECNKCGITKQESEYSKGKYSCKPCNSKASMERARLKRLKDPDLFKKKQRDASRSYRKRHRDRVLVARRLREGKTGMSKEEYRAYQKVNRKNKSVNNDVDARKAWRHWLYKKAPDEWIERYYAAMGKPWKNHRLSDAERYRIRYREDEEFNLKERLRRQITKAEKRDGIGDVIRQGLKMQRRSKTIERRLGYSLDELKKHIEAQFVKRMNWKAYKDGRIHIDHIVPQSSFNTHDDGEWRECWSLSNLRPMWAKDNLAKRDKRETLL